LDTFHFFPLTEEALLPRGDTRDAAIAVSGVATLDRDLSQAGRREGDIDHLGERAARPQLGMGKYD
jgi:hypothetical protein